jgi:aryl-alcohol dehydrogenase-like predicted oxidoreductase
MLRGRATAEGTARYAELFADRVPKDHFRETAGGVRVSTIGLGTYLGREDDATDAQYRRAIERGLEGGVNVVDTAVNYREQRSERAVGAALADAVRRGAVARDEVVVATKGGFIPFDFAVAGDRRRYVLQTYLETGIIRPDDVVGGAHCLTPAFLADQIARSRANLGVATLDVYYLHNPELQLEEGVERPAFLARMRAAFGRLEQAVADEHIGCYGTATWHGFRVDAGERGHLSLQELVGLARDVAGAEHHFRVVQAPYNLGMPEAFTRATQVVDGVGHVSLLEAAERLRISVMASAPLHQGQLTRNLPAVVAEMLPGLDTDGQRALQFVRSTPGITAALVGMKSPAHVTQNLKVAATPPLPWEQFQRLFTTA